MYSKIVETGRFRPEEAQWNGWVEDRLEPDSEWIVERTGKEEVTIGAGRGLIRRYAQSIWRRLTGYEWWYRYIADVYNSIDYRLQQRIGRNERLVKDVGEMSK